MPDLNTRIHLDMLQDFRRQVSLANRLRRAAHEFWSSKKLYGLEWGDPDTVEPLRFVRDRYVTPYVDPTHAAVEIGPGGGRWTRYLLGFRTLYCVDFYSEMLDELRKTFNRPHMTFIKNNGTDFPGIQGESVDFLFSFGCFVHLDAHLIASYLRNASFILRPGAKAVIQYSDKSKIMARLSPGFSDNGPEQMRSMVTSEGFRVLEEDLTTLWHSSIILFER